MSVFLDTGYFVALINKQDIYRKEALTISELIKDGKYGIIFTSNYIFDELITHIMVRQNHSKAVKVGQSIIESDIKILEVLQTTFDDSWSLFKQRKNLSFTDCTIVKAMEQNNIKNLATFDKEFKQFKEINILM